MQATKRLFLRVDLFSNIKTSSWYLKINKKSKTLNTKKSRKRKNKSLNVILANVKDIRFQVRL